MVRFLLWNLNRKPLQRTVAELARNYDIDVLILIECAIPVGTMLRALNTSGDGLYRLPSSVGKEPIIYTRFSERMILPIQEEGNRLTIRRIVLPACTDILLAVVHLPSKMYWSDQSQDHECMELARKIREVEARIGHDRTIVTGDFNVNPFADGMVSSAGFHAAATREVARKQSRTVQRRNYPFFYNPMWGFFGDARGEPPGTYYYEHAEHVCYFWNMFDQVLVRPALMDRFRNDELRILTSDGASSLVSERGLPDAGSASDHLPVIFALDLETGETSNVANYP